MSAFLGSMKTEVALELANTYKDCLRIVRTLNEAENSCFRGPTLGLMRWGSLSKGVSASSLTGSCRREIVVLLQR